MMVLAPPPYLHAARIQDETIRYVWDDWNVEQAEEPIDQDFLERLGRISQRAVCGFVNASAEWIVHRFEKLTNTASAHQYLEAAWAQIVDWRYGACSWEECVPKEDWTGPVRGPIGTAMTRVMYALEQTKENGFPELRGAWISNLTVHLMPDPSPYLQWRDETITHLQILFARDPAATLGDVVPREALDPTYPFTPEQIEPLVNHFLAGLDHNSNSFLNSPARMLQLGFTGEPYIFDIEKDRREREA